MNKKMIGILAGMGPRSTAPFIDLVVDECQRQYGAKNDEDFPHMMIYSLPTPFFIDRPIDHELMKKTIIEGLRRLESAGADFIAMPCNSAHVYYDDLAASVNIPLLNIVEETLKKLPEAVQRVTLFATGSTFDSQIYQKGIWDAGHKFIFKDGWQARINGLIGDIKRDKRNPQNYNNWNELLKEAAGESVVNIIIACTDLNILLSAADTRFNIIDSSASLAEAVVGKYLE